MAIVTKPVILDETGKEIRDALDSASASILASITDGYNKDMTLQEVVDARGEFTSLGQRLTYEKGKTNQLEQELEETLQDVKDYVDDAADKILADITDEFNIDGTLQEVVDARGDFVSLGQRLDNDDERLGVLEQTTRDLEYWKTTNNALPKVEGEGTDITLDNTADSPLTLGFKASGSTQFTTTGKNSLNEKSFVAENCVINNASNGSLEITNSGTNCRVVQDMSVDENQDYMLSLKYSNTSLNSLRLQIYGLNGVINTSVEKNDASGIVNLTFNSRTATTVSVRLYTNNTNVSNTNKVYFTELQVEKGTTATNFEPYTGNQPSPSPDYPQDIHVVKGDNEVVIVNKNLFDKDNTNYVSDLTFNDDFSKFQTTTNPTRIYYIECEHNKTYTIHKTIGTILRCGNCNTIPAENGDISSSYRNADTNQVTFTTNSTDRYIYLYLLTGIESRTISYDDVLQTLQVEKGSQATPYTEHKEQNYPLNLGVKNKFDEEKEVGSVLADGTNYENANCWRSVNYISVEPNTTYTLSFKDVAFSTTQGRLIYCDENKIATTGSNNIAIDKNDFTFTTPTNCKYIRFFVITATVPITTKTMLEEGNKAHSYSPYGVTPIEMCKIGDYADEFFKNVPECEYYDSTLEEGKWYKYGRIDKVVLNGSENWTMPNTISYSLDKRLINNANIPANTLTNYIVNSFTKVANLETSTIGTCWAGSSYINFNFDSTDDNLNNFKEWLNENNIIMYYILATPTKTLLSDTLQGELDNISYAMAYQDQTNISQVNGDRPFVISAKTVLDLKTLVTNMN